MWGKVAWFAIKAVAGGMLSYIAPRALIAMGVPLDEWIGDAFGRLSVEPVLWAISVVLFAVLFFADRIIGHMASRPSAVSENRANDVTPPVILPSRGPIIRQLNPTEIEVARSRQAKAQQGLSAEDRHTEIVNAKAKKPKPDLPLANLLSRVYQAFGQEPDTKSDKEKFWTKVNLAIADKVVGEELNTWGRIGERALTPIEVDTWQHGTFDHRAGALYAQAAYSSGYEITDLHFYEVEIELIWPEPSRSGGARSSNVPDNLSIEEKKQIVLGSMHAAQSYDSSSGLSAKQHLERNASFLRIRRHLSDEFRRTLNLDLATYPPEGPNDMPRLLRDFLDEVDTIATRWGVG